jgi:uncharacterized YigZ family protein
VSHTLAHTVEHQESIKRSRFLVLAAPATTVEAAQLVLEQRRQHLPDASHHCWAYRIEQQDRFSDDGEPAGTAGRPMLEVLMKRDLLSVIAVVSRYFGGTKLGAGGLVRAYGGSLAKALDRSQLVEIKERLQLRLFVPFELMDRTYRLIQEIERLEQLASRYSTAGLELDIEIDRQEKNALVARLTEVSSGRIDTHCLES